MRKNVVQRLQTIQQDLTSVISIYDITSQSTKTDDVSESQSKQIVQDVPEIDSSKSFEKVKPCNNFRCPSHASFNPVKKTDSISGRTFKITNSDESILARNGNLQTLKQEKPGSAPTPSSSTRQSDYVSLLSPEPSSGTSDSSRPSTAQPTDDSHQRPWYECASSTDFEGLKAQSDAPNVLEENYCDENGKCKDKPPPDKPPFKSGAQRRGACKIPQNKSIRSVKRVAGPEIENEPQNIVPRGSYTHTPRKEKSNFNELDTSNIPTSTCSTNSKAVNDVKKDKPFERNSKIFSRVPKAIRPRIQSPDAKKTTQISKPGTWKVNKDDEGTNNGKGSPSVKISEGINSREREEEKSTGEKQLEGDKNLSASFNGQKTPRSAGEEDVDLSQNDSSTAPIRTNEKLLRMKLSKELALNIAKQLKDKNDELRSSGEELLEKLKKAEKENKRLSKEIKTAELYKKKLYLKFGEMRNESKTIMTEREMKAKQIEEENTRLKTKIGEMEKQHDEKLLEKQKEIDHVQKESARERRNESKLRESLKLDNQRLTVEKLDLLKKVEELRDLLNKSHLKTEKLAEENRRLQESQSQNQDLKKKKKTHEETNYELESIRQNSKDLEQQVKTLRKSIEAFEEVQQRLNMQTKEYQQKMQSGLEEIEKLKNENSQLKKDLENEKDALLIKVKVIEDQQETIKKLKEKSEEVKALEKKIQGLERILNIEREEKLELEEAVEHLVQRKEELKNKIKYLENDLLLAPQEVVKDLQKTQIVLHELENQVQAKQKEWEFHFQCLSRQKEQACNVAEFATKKLMRTTDEFQKQTEAYKALQKILADSMTMNGKT